MPPSLSCEVKVRFFRVTAALLRVVVVCGGENAWLEFTPGVKFSFCGEKPKGFDKTWVLLPNISHGICWRDLCPAGISKSMKITNRSLEIFIFFKKAFYLLGKTRQVNNFMKKNNVLKPGENSMDASFYFIFFHTSTHHLCDILIPKMHTNQDNYYPYDVVSEIHVWNLWDDYVKANVQKKTPHYSACDQITTGSHVNIYLHFTCFITITRAISSSTSVQISANQMEREKKKSLENSKLGKLVLHIPHEIYSTNFTCNNGVTIHQFCVSTSSKSFKKITHNTIPQSNKNSKTMFTNMFIILMFQMKMRSWWIVTSSVVVAVVSITSRGYDYRTHFTGSSPTLSLNCSLLYVLHSMY